MKEQIAVAAKWWADRLREEAKQDNGDAMTTIFASMVAGAIKKTTPEQADEFEKKLAELLVGHLSRSEWKEDQPHWGSYMRVLETDYHPCKCIRDAAEHAGICGDCPPFPMKTIMWINPDSVKVGYGYGAPVVELWRIEKGGGK